jgi:hypothetical protein
MSQVWTKAPPIPATLIEGFNNQRARDLAVYLDTVQLQTGYRPPQCRVFSIQVDCGFVHSY